MSDEKKTNQTADHEKARQSGDPFAREDADGKAKETARADEKARAQNEQAAAGDDASLHERVHDLEERLKRAVAEQENLRKRMEREKADVAKYAMANFAREVLGIADNIQRAIDAVPRDAAGNDPALKTFLEGIEVTERELHKAMERHGIARLNPEGEKFDPNYHQAMFEIPTSDMPSGMVMQVVQPGYMLEDRVLRPAMVGVSKAAPAASSASEPGAKADNPGPKTPPADDTPAQEQQAAPGKAQASAKMAGDEAQTASAKPDEPSAQPRGASRLNEPVINGESGEDYENESASRKA